MAGHAGQNLVARTRGRPSWKATCTPGSAWHGPNPRKFARSTPKQPHGKHSLKRLFCVADFGIGDSTEFIGMEPRPPRGHDGRRRPNLPFGVFVRFCSSTRRSLPLLGVSRTNTPSDTTWKRSGRFVSGSPRPRSLAGMGTMAPLFQKSPDTREHLKASFGTTSLHSSPSHGRRNYRGNGV